MSHAQLTGGLARRPDAEVPLHCVPCFVLVFLSPLESSRVQIYVQSKAAGRASSLTSWTVSIPEKGGDTADPHWRGCVCCAILWMVFLESFRRFFTNRV